MLALLVLEAGRVVPAGQLVEEVWAGRPPPGAAKTLRSYVSRLRSALAPDLPVVSRGGGYAVSAGPGDVDARRFERLVAEGQAVLGEGEAAAAANRFREALGLWQGRAFTDVLDVALLAREAARLEELRLVATEGRIEADLALGLAPEVTGELEGLVAEYPLRERLWWLLMLGLYRCGRQADALAAYQRARMVLAGELGLEAGAELRDLEQAVLRQQVPPAAAHRELSNLPAPLTSFVGRERELTELRKLLAQARLVTLTGPGGSGKTRLAVELSAMLVDRFTDGAWLTDLAGITDPGLVGAQVVEALGVRPGGDLPVLDALRYRLRSADLLLVLDNCEHLADACADLADGLLASSPGLRVLATSREPLGVTGEAVYPVQPLAIPPQGAAPEVSAQAPAVRLFLDRVWAARGGVGGEPGPGGAVAGICRELDGLPLAIELAAARASTLSIAEIQTHLADKFRFLRQRLPAAGQRHQALKAAIDWSFELLSAAEREVFGELSVFAGSFGLEQAAAVCSSGDQAAALDVIDRLASKSLLTVNMPVSGTRYRMLETIREYAAGQLAETGETEPARHRHALAFLTLAECEHAITALSRDHDNFRAALDWSLRNGGEAGPELARALGDFWLGCGYFAEARDWVERALARHPADDQVRADLLRLLGTILDESGDPARAQTVLSEGLRVAEAAGLPAAQARIRLTLTEIELVQGPGDSYTQRMARCEAARATLAAHGDLNGLAQAWLTIGQLLLGHDDRAAEQAFERTVEYARSSGNRAAGLNASRWLIDLSGQLPAPVDEAINRAEQLLVAFSGDPWAETVIRQPLSWLYALAGRFADARATIGRAQSVQSGSGANIDRAVSALYAGDIEMLAGDAAAAEREMKRGRDMLRAMGKRGFLGYALFALAEAVYTQGRADEAEGLIEEAKALAEADDPDAQVLWLAIRAKVLAQRGEIAAAMELTSQAETLVASTPAVKLRAEVLKAKAEVARLAGARQEAARNLREALRIYEQRGAAAPADRTRAALASLATDPG